MWTPPTLKCETPAWNDSDCNAGSDQILDHGQVLERILVLRCDVSQSPDYYGGILRRLRPPVWIYVEL